MKDLISQLTPNPHEQKILRNFFNIEQDKRERLIETLLNGVVCKENQAHKTKKPPIISNIPDYNGAAVYALIDDKGKAYIGSTLHLKMRIMQHNSMMRTVCPGSRNGLVNSKIASAILEGRTFRCKVLVKVYEQVSKHELEDIERVFINHFGGNENTYNMKP